MIFSASDGFLGSGFGISCRLERIAFGEFAGQGVLGQLGLCFRLSPYRRHDDTILRLRVCVGRQEGRPVGFVRRCGRLARLVRDNVQLVRDWG